MQRYSEGEHLEDISPEAYCDALFILNDAPKSVLPMSVIEMHLFSYLGCILGLFQGKPIGDWGYSFAVTSEGFPFSAGFEQARRSLVSSGLVESDDDGAMAPYRPAIDSELETVLATGSWAERRRWLRGATECALALPIGAIRYAIGQTPGMVTSLQIKQRRPLLDADDVELLYDEYRVVNAVLGADAQDVLSPAVIWLSARVLRKEGG